MPTGFEPNLKGVAKVPSFYKGSKKTPTKTKAGSLFSSEHLPILAGAVLLGVGIILILRSRSGGSNGTGAALTVVPDTSADQSSIENMTATINALIAMNQNQTPNLPISGDSSGSNPPTSIQTSSSQPPGYIAPTPSQGAVATAVAAAVAAPSSYTYATDTSKLMSPVAAPSSYNPFNVSAPASSPAVLTATGPQYNLGTQAFAIPTSVAPANVPALYAQNVSQAQAAGGANYSNTNYLAWLQSVGSKNYLGVNSGLPDPTEWAQNVAVAQGNIARGLK